MRAERFMVAAIIIFLSVMVGANECTAPKPPKVFGALCGRLIDATGAAVPDVELRVLGDSDHVIADVRADASGDFIFPDLAKAKYRLTATSAGWLIEFGKFEVKRSRVVCTNPVTVRLDVACCCFGSGIIKKRPPHY